MAKVFLWLMMFFIGYEAASVHDWRDKFTKMIENGRTLNCTKASGPKGSKIVKFHEIPLHSSNKFESSGFNSSYKNANGSSNIELEHVELHFNITNVFEDNSENHPYSGQQHYNDYADEVESERADNGTSIESVSAVEGGQDNSTDNSGKSPGKKNDDKSVNSPVYVIFT